MATNPVTAAARSGPGAAGGGWNAYHAPASVAEAVDLLEHYDGRARVLGGGTDLLVELRRGRRRAPQALVDATGIDGLGGIGEQDGYLVIGCGVTHTEISTDPRIARHGTCLAESCGIIGGPQVRNVGTLAGNVAQALPAGDGTIGLLALDGEIEVATTGGRRWIPLAEAFLGPGESAVDRQRAVLTRLRFKPTGAGEGTAFHRVMRPQGLCLPIISIAARLRVDGDGTITQARIGMGPVGPVPCVAEPAMEVLLGGPPSKRRFERAAAAALASVTLRTSKYRATDRYREAMVRTFLPLILARAAERAAGAPT